MKDETQPSLTDYLGLFGWGAAAIAFRISDNHPATMFCAGMMLGWWIGSFCNALRRMLHDH